MGSRGAVVCNPVKWTLFLCTCRSRLLDTKQCQLILKEVFLGREDGKCCDVLYPTGNYMVPLIVSAARLTLRAFYGD